MRDHFIREIQRRRRLHLSINQTRESLSHFGFSPLKRDPVHAAFALASFSYPTSPSWLTDGTFGADPEAFLLSSVFCRGGNQPISRLAAPVGSAGFLLPSIRPDTADITVGQPESEGGPRRPADGSHTCRRRRVVLLSDNWSQIPTLPSRR